MVNSEVSSTSKTVETKITVVTVYTDQALVTRRGIIELTGEEQKLVINHLPATLQTDSVRVGGSGKIAVGVLAVSTERIYSSEPVAAKVSQITQHIEQLESEMNYLQAQLDGLALQSRFIEGLREKTEEPFAQSISRKNLSLSETLDFVNFLGSQFTEYGIATRDYSNRKQEIEKELKLLQKQLQDVQNPHPKESFRLVIDIETRGIGEFELEVSYVVNYASWTPLYDVRVNSSSSIVNLSYLAEVTQNTGEDWEDVLLTLSTAKPGLGTLPPKLEPWYLNIRTVMPFAGAAPASASLDTPDFVQRKRTLSQSVMKENDAEEILIEAETINAEILREGSVVSFKLNSSGNIPSDRTPHKVTIFNDNFDCNFAYVAMPRLVSFAYLQTTVKNPANGATLLPGKANIFRDNMFVGTTQLDNIAPGQEFKVNLGIDEGLKIERELVERQVDKKLIGSNRKITFGYRLVITNLLSRETKLILTEQIPKSRHEQIKVSLNRSNPQIQLGEMGVLEWLLNLAPQGKQEVYYQFTVEHPPQLNIVGLDI
ncbi:mucoidy inhibitor MuiA family protein [Calothrix sp. UHCC 0171]|uniref:mucoidy inhibitor MuiA family protein n=1 Tax=Calothrix sp. UHCC 0171 TaxID=3110245 RepID=UPI002B1F59B6|nr:mucoidy inhibitor MuiA family protein [Calothrix sp. UHCC 0171]MEA5571591.1 mucoidy inhibitor MuiA family protein [Calothrix sp. UHCC 0171]